jgi:hypothetical protein
MKTIRILRRKKQKKRKRTYVESDVHSLIIVSYRMTMIYLIACKTMKSMISAQNRRQIEATRRRAEQKSCIDILRQYEKKKIFIYRDVSQLLDRIRPMTVFRCS